VERRKRGDVSERKARQKNRGGEERGCWGKEIVKRCVCGLRAPPKESRSEGEVPAGAAEKKSTSGRDGMCRRRVQRERATVWDGGGRETERGRVGREKKIFD